MAVGDHLPVSAASASSSSSSSSAILQRRHLVQVATNNSSAFIHFPTNARQSSLFTPTYRSQTNQSTTRAVSRTTDIQSISNKSKSSSTDHQTNHSKQKFNPILNNSLLNYRKEQPKSSSIKTSVEFTQTIRLCLSSQPLRNKSNDHQSFTDRARTAPILSEPTDNSISDEHLILIADENNDQEEIPQLDQTKRDYITRWLHEVEQATTSSETLPKIKRAKTRLVRT